MLSASLWRVREIARADRQRSRCDSQAVPNAALTALRRGARLDANKSNVRRSDNRQPCRWRYDSGRSRDWTCVGDRLASVPTPLVSFAKDHLWMFTPPGRAALPIFTDNDSKPHAGPTLAILATLTQFQHAITQFVYSSARWRRWSNLDRGRSRRRTILRRNHNPRS